VLLSIPAAVRFVSVEPMLGPIEMSRQQGSWLGPATQSRGMHDGIDWVICGGESGPGARPMHPAWARALRDQCQAAGVPFFFKQWGEWAPGAPVYPNTNQEQEAWDQVAGEDNVEPIELSGNMPLGAFQPSPGSWLMHRVGRAAAGDLLDGKQHHAFPKGAEQQ
jgi:hypothetical protein